MPMENLRYLLLVSMLVVASTVSGQGQKSFYKTYSGGPFDKGEGIVQLPDSAYAITGMSSSFVEGKSQAFITKIDSLGNRLWSRSYGGANSDRGKRIFYEHGVGFWVAGFSNSTATGDFDYYLFHTNEDGHLVWEKHFENTGWDRLWDAIRLDDGSFLMAGQAQANNGSSSGYLLKTDANGEKLWEHFIESPNDDIIYTIENFTDTTFLIAGQQNSPSTNLPSAFIRCMDFDGQTVWETFYNVGNDVGAVHDLSFFGNEILAAGEILEEGEDDINHWLFRTNREGDFIFEEVLQFPGKTYASNICVLDAGRAFWTFYTESPAQNVYPVGPDLILQRYFFTLFFFDLSVSLSGYDPDVCNEMIPTSDGGLILVGTVSDQPWDASNGSNVLVYKIGPNDEAVTEREEGDHLVNTNDYNPLLALNLFPNPANTFIELQGVPMDAPFEIRNSAGQVLKKGIYNGNKISVEELASGIYFIRLISANKYVTMRFIIDK